ncbi:MAG: cobalamin-dependent protein, partial [Deltaproteobacteria bacterium]|nr:cobalamin-dependent protein [Deltaproteobacteria bacterium]
MLEITLIQPFRPERTGNISEDSWQLTRPFSLFFLAAALNKCGRFKVHIIDLETKTYKDRSETEIFKENYSQIFGITATTYTRFKAIELAKLIKRMHSEAMVVVGGVHFTYCAEETLLNVPEIDVVVRGEGELAIVELAAAVEKKETIDSIAGISFRKNGEIICNPDRKEQIDVDDLGVYELYSIDDYPEYLYGEYEKI